MSDKPQDLSKSRDQLIPETFCSSVSSDNPAISRPQIIVSPRKIETVEISSPDQLSQGSLLSILLNTNESSQDVSSQSNTASTVSGCSTPSTSSSRSPSKSVIVRAGSSNVSNNCNFFIKEYTLPIL